MRAAASARKRKSKGNSSPPQARSDYRYALALLALSTLTVLAFSNAFQSGFILDNKGLLLDPRIRDITPANLALIFRHSYWWPNGESGLYRPVTTLSYLFNYAFLGDGENATGYHTVNLVLHLGNVWLAFALALRLIRSFWPATLLTGLWAIHPALTESVTNIVGRADLLVAMAVLSGMLLYLKARESSGGRHIAFLSALGLVTAIGVLSKESAVAILPLIVVYELVWWNGPSSRSALFAGLAATGLPIAAMLIARWTVLSASPAAEFPFTDNPIIGADWWMGRLTAMNVILRYLGLTLWPWNLSCDYSYRQIPVATGSIFDWLGYVALIIIAAASLLFFRRNRSGIFLLFFALINLLPASNLLFPIGTIMADRLLYLPSFGILGCLVLGIYACKPFAKLAFIPPLLIGLIIASYTVRTWLRNADWQTELRIATADVRISPNSFKLHRLLAASLFESDPAHSNVDQVIAEQEKSVAILDSLPNRLNRPDVYRQAGYYDLIKARQSRDMPAYRSAIGHLLRCIAIDESGRALYRSVPGLAKGDEQAYLLLSIAYLESGDSEKALDAANKAKFIDPLDSRVYRQLSAVFSSRGLRSEAAAAAAIEDAITSLQKQNWQGAADLSGSVLNQNYPAAYLVNAMANLHLRNLDVAERSARAAGNMPRATYVLGLILAEKHDLKQSAKLLRAYLDGLPNSLDAETVRAQLKQIESSITSNVH
jgi:tetratricopeptide (TPR) repeat protein